MITSVREASRLSCPPLPLRCSDRQEYPGSGRGAGYGKNRNYILYTELEWSGVGVVRLEDSLIQPERELFYPRGTYIVRRHCLKVRTWNGFLECLVEGSADSAGTLTIYPEDRRMEQTVPAKRDHAPEKPAWLSWMKDRDLFESRPYYAGDDPRRINWNMLALHDELFIKEGSSLSPSRKSALLVIDTSGKRRAVDGLFRNLSSLIDSLAAADLQITALLPGLGVVRELEKLDRGEKENLLASVPPVSVGLSGIEAAGGAYGVVYLFSVKQSEEQQTILERLSPGARRILVQPGSSPAGGGLTGGRRRDRQIKGQRGWYLVKT